METNPASSVTSSPRFEDAINWERAISFMSHRIGDIDYDLWKAAVCIAQADNFRIFGNSVKMSRSLSPEEMETVVGFDSLLPYVGLSTFVFSGIDFPRSLDPGRPDATGSVPTFMKTGTVGRASLSKYFIRRIQDARDEYHPDTIKLLTERTQTISEEVGKRKATGGNGWSYVVEMSADPYDMCKMGYLSIDQNACFYSSGAGAASPAAIAQTHGGFFLRVYRSDAPWKSVARCWGSLREGQYIHLTNWYPNTSGAIRDKIPLIEGIIASWFGFTPANKEKIAIHKEWNGYIYGRGEGFDRDNACNLYVNADSTIYFSGRKPSHLPYRLDGIPRHRLCPSRAAASEYFTKMSKEDKTRIFGVLSLKDANDLSAFGGFSRGASAKSTRDLYYSVCGPGQADALTTVCVAGALVRDAQGNGYPTFILESLGMGVDKDGVVHNQSVLTVNKSGQVVVK